MAPVPPGDDVMTTLAAPGASLHYRVRVPVTQPPGLYWYHPHAHGETYWQVTSGMAGAIVVEGLRERVPSLQTMRERTIVVRDVQRVPNIMAIPWYARKMTPRLAHAVDADDNPGPNAPCLPEPGLYLTLNGLSQPKIAVADGERQLFRVLNASASRVLDLAVDNEQIGVVAIDGYPVGSYTGNPTILWMSHVVLPPAGRAEFVVTGSRVPTVLRTRCYRERRRRGSRPASGARDDFQRRFRRAVASSTAANDQAGPSAKATAIAVPRPNVHRTIVLTEDANGFYINGRAFRMNAPPAVIVRAGTVEEWTLLNKTDEVHDIHIHQVHFLVESIDGKNVVPRLWRDTVLVPVQTHDGRQNDARRRAHSRRLSQPGDPRHVRLPLSHARSRRRRHDGND